jgi:HK97 family phage portal protein
MVTLPPEKILHFHGLGWDGRVGYSPIDMAREALSFAKATEIYGSNFFHQGGQPSGVLEMEGTLKDQNAADRLREQWMSIHGGVENSHRIAVLENGLKYKPISLPPNSAQFLETRKFQKADIAQMYRVPLHMINELDRATFSNIEHQSIEFVVHTIRPYLVRFEQELKRKLFVTNSDNRYFAEWLVDGLLRGDAKSRNEALQIQRQNGIINADEWREIENMNPIEDGSGKVYLVNSAMISIDQAMIPLNQRKGGEPSEGQGNQKPNGNSGNPQGSGGQTD